MSDAPKPAETEDEPRLLASAVKSSVRINGANREVVKLTAVSGRQFEVVPFDVVEQWDFMELAGTNAGNAPWITTAMFVNMVSEIDGQAVPGGSYTRERTRVLLRRLGTDGLNAVSEYFRRGGPSDDKLPAAAGVDPAVVGNSSGTPISS